MKKTQLYFSKKHRHSRRIHEKLMDPACHLLEIIGQETGTQIKLGKTTKKSPLHKRNTLYQISSKKEDSAQDHLPMSSAAKGNAFPFDAKGAERQLAAALSDFDQQRKANGKNKSLFNATKSLRNQLSRLLHDVTDGVDTANNAVAYKKRVEHMLHVFNQKPEDERLPSFGLSILNILHKLDQDELEALHEKHDALEQAAIDPRHPLHRHDSAENAIRHFLKRIKQKENQALNAALATAPHEAKEQAKSFAPSEAKKQLTEALFKINQLPQKLENHPNLKEQQTLKGDLIIEAKIFREHVQTLYRDVNRGARSACSPDSYRQRLQDLMNRAPTEDYLSEGRSAIEKMIHALDQDEIKTLQENQAKIARATQNYQHLAQGYFTPKERVAIDRQVASAIKGKALGTGRDILVYDAVYRSIMAAHVSEKEVKQYFAPVAAVQKEKPAPIASVRPKSIKPASSHEPDPFFAPKHFSGIGIARGKKPYASYLLSVGFSPDDALCRVGIILPVPKLGCRLQDLLSETAKKILNAAKSNSLDPSQEDTAAKKRAQEFYAEKERQLLDVRHQRVLTTHAETLCVAACFDFDNPDLHGYGNIALRQVSFHLGHGHAERIISLDDMNQEMETARASSPLRLCQKLFLPDDPDASAEDLDAVLSLRVGKEVSRFAMQEKIPALHRQMDVPAHQIQYITTSRRLSEERELKTKEQKDLQQEKYQSPAIMGQRFAQVLNNFLLAQHLKGEPPIAQMGLQAYAGLINSGGHRPVPRP